MYQIKLLSELRDQAQTQAAIASLREIFFLTSSRTQFVSDGEREDFFDKWTNYYLSRCANEVFLAVAGGDSTRAEVGLRAKDNVALPLLGYLTGCSNSYTARKFLQLSSFEVFHDLFDEYPAHLHINCHPHGQGKGVGSALIHAFIDYLIRSRIKGVHIITSPTAANVNFYRKHGFDFSLERSLNSTPVMFMGRIFTTA